MRSLALSTAIAPPLKFLTAPGQRRGVAPGGQRFLNRRPTIPSRCASVFWPATVTILSELVPARPTETPARPRPWHAPARPNSSHILLRRALGAGPRGIPAGGEATGKPAGRGSHAGEPDGGARGELGRWVPKGGSIGTPGATGSSGRGATRVIAGREGTEEPEPQCHGVARDGGTPGGPGRWEPGGARDG